MVNGICEILDYLRTFVALGVISLEMDRSCYGSVSVLQATNCVALLLEKDFLREGGASPCCGRVSGIKADCVGSYK